MIVSCLPRLQGKTAELVEIVKSYRTNDNGIQNSAVLLCATIDEMMRIRAGHGLLPFECMTVEDFVRGRHARTGRRVFIDNVDFVLAHWLHSEVRGFSVTGNLSPGTYSFHEWQNPSIDKIKKDYNLLHEMIGAGRQAALKISELGMTNFHQDYATGVGNYRVKIEKIS